PGLGPMNNPPISLAAPRVQRARWTPVLMACAAVIVLAALWSGLVHLGLELPQVTESLHDGHGPMMILGFLGTLITMERAVALGERWAFLGPAFSACPERDRKSTRLNSSHVSNSYAVFCLKKK